MKKLIVDVENTTTELGDTKYRDFSPYNSNNKLVSIGWAWLIDGIIGPVKYAFVFHKEIEQPQYDRVEEFKRDLAEAEVLIAHNAKYDLQWLAESGFNLSHCVVECTMVREYVMCRGRGDISLRLGDTCKRYNVTNKGELFDKYPDLQISEMPIAEVEDYGITDVLADAELYLAQTERLKRDGYQTLVKTIDMMNEFLLVLVGMERAGVKIDEAALNKVEAEYIAEAEHLKFWLNNKVKEVMGDTLVNLDSPAQLSEVIYSRRLKTGKEEQWCRTFNIGRDDRGKPLRRPRMSTREYVANAVEMTDRVMKTKAARCEPCEARGWIQKIRKDGQPFKKTTKCKPCEGTGIIYNEINEIAGFKFKAKNIAWTTVSGFTTSHTFLDELANEASGDAKEFVEKLQRLSSISSYLSNFVGGINTFKQSDNILHPNFNQCITATGRLSCTKPNLQNQPREATFPIRRVFISRFEGGTVTEVDFKTLEFRAAIHLSRCENGKKDILNGSDIHIQTSRIITENGQPIGRQDAKSRTFKPLFGGVTGTDAERAYYSQFTTKLYPGIGEWHKQLEETAIAKHIITLETGRQFIFPDVVRAWHGGCSKSTQVKNFPVQSFATADIVPISLIRLQKEFKKRNLKSILVLTVHDSVLVDTHPDEVAIVLELVSNLGRYAEQDLRERYGIEPFIPFDVEVKSGLNAMEMKKVA